MKKIRNEKIEGRFYTDDYIGNLTSRIYKLEKQLEKYKKVTKEIEDLEKFWLKGGTYIIPIEVMNNIYGMIEEIGEDVSNESN